MVPKNKEEVTIFEGELYSQQSLDLDVSKYSKLQITYAMYDYLEENTAGCSNIALLDLTKTGKKNTAYQCSVAHPYNIFASEGTNIEISMSAGFKVNASKTTFKALFSYSGTVQKSTTTQYYVSKIVGII